MQIAKEASLVVKVDLLRKKLITHQKELSEPEKRFQENKEKMKIWKGKLKKIQGDFENPKNSLDTVAFYKDELNFIEQNLQLQLDQLRITRINKSLEIFENKKRILDLYNEFKSSIDNIINQDKKSLDVFRITIDTSFKLEKDFYNIFLDFINKSVKGSFHTFVEGEKCLNKIFDEKDLTKKDDIKEILENVIFYLENDQREGIIDSKRNIQDQIGRLDSFYEFIFSLNYLEPQYELKLDNKTLNQLSPGEKGALLLVFYLMIDKEDTPLIIDQPEDNLDNQSVFKVLTHFIKYAKKKRQIIVVTHNPNLAVGADADQIIYVNLDKENNYCFAYESGSIENPEINRHIVNILEGTKPAFDKRKLKLF